MDHLEPLLKNLFPYSQIAQSLSIKQSKSNCIITNVLGRQQFTEICDLLRRKKFSICIDESTDRSCDKIICIVCRVYCVFDSDSSEQPAGNNRVRDVLFAIADVNDASANGLYKLIVDLFTKHGIDYKSNLVGFGSDAASVMVGQWHSVSSLLKGDCPNLKLFKCICHSLATCMSKSCEMLPLIVEELPHRIYNYIGKSPKRLLEFKTLQVDFGENPYRLLKPAQTRSHLREI